MVADGQCLGCSLLSDLGRDSEQVTDGCSRCLADIYTVDLALLPVISHQAHDFSFLLMLTGQKVTWKVFLSGVIEKQLADGKGTWTGEYLCGSAKVLL